jgi:hypothetical protein
MTYHPAIHEAQMAAAALNEHFIRALATEGYVRTYHTRNALEEFGKLAAKVHAVATADAKPNSKEAA